MSLSYNLSEQEIQALLAAINPFAGGNSRLARSLRARLQPRDTKGRWVKTGVAVSFDGRYKGKSFPVVAKSAGPSSRTGFIQLYIPQGDENLPFGFYEVESEKGNVVKAIIERPEAEQSKESITSENVVDFDTAPRSDAPEGWDYAPKEDGTNRWVSQDGKLEIVENSETGKVDLFENGEKVSEQDDVPRALAESDRRDIEQSLTRESQQVVARLRARVQDARTAKDAGPRDVEEAEENLDRALFDDPDYEETLQLVDSAAPNPESLGEDVTISEKDLADMRKSPITSKHLDKDGNFTPERKALHDDIVRRALEGSTPVENPTQWMNGGGPGAGKSSLTQGSNKDLTGYDENSVLLDPDEVKKELPEVKEAIARLEARGALPEDTDWAGMSHEESSYIAKRIHLASLERHHNIILDGTGDSGFDKVREKVELARKNGYQRVEANYLYLDPNEGLKRAKAREEVTFRKVPETVTRSTYETISAIFPELADKQLFDTLRLFDNNKQEGEQAELIFEQKDGETEIKNREAYNRFLGRDPLESDIQRRAIDEGGASVNLMGEEAPATGYMVSFPPVDGIDPVSKEDFEDPEKGPQAIRNLLDRGLDLLKDGGYIGIWFDADDKVYDSEGNVVGDKPENERDPKYYLDISEYYTPDQLEEAKQVGRERNQIAIYDLENKTEIPVGGTGEREEGQEDSRGTPSGEDVGRGPGQAGEEPVDTVDSEVSGEEAGLASLESLTDRELTAELQSLQEAYVDLQFRAQGTEGPEDAEIVNREILRIATRFDEIDQEIASRAGQQQEDDEETDTVESLTTRIESIDAQIGRRIQQGRDTKDLDERYSNLIAKREALQKGEQPQEPRVEEELENVTVPYFFAPGTSTEELQELRATYQEELVSPEADVDAPRIQATLDFIDRILATRGGQTIEKEQAPAPVRASRRMNAPLLETNDPESGSTEPHTPQKPEPDDDGVTDNPELLADIFSRNVLTVAFTQSLVDGADNVTLGFPSADAEIFTTTRASVPVPAIRDALQLQGFDTNKLVETYRAEREDRSQKRDSTPVAPDDVIERLSEEVELYNLVNTYEALRNDSIVALHTEPAGSRRITSINERMVAINSRIRRLEARGLRTTQPPSADAIEGFKWDFSTEPDIYRPELIMDALEQRYPNSTRNDDGELVIGEAEYEVGGNRFRYEAVITRTDDEQFYVYIRETNLSNDDPATRSRSVRFGDTRHSARAVNNEASKALDKIFNRAGRSSINSWFNDRRRVREGRAPKFDVPDAQGMPHHVRDQVLTREAIRNIQEAVDEDGITEEMIGSLYNYIRNFGNDTAVLQALYSTFGLDVPTLNRFVDAVNQNIHERDGLNSFSLWESDNGTPLAEGDLVTYIGDPNQRGFERLGGRKALVKIRSLEHTSNGYTYTDYVQIQLLNQDGTPDNSEEYVVASSHNLRLERTSGNTDGSERRGPDAISMPLPVLTVRAGNRYAGRGRLGSVAPYVTEYDRDTLASPTVEIDDVQYPVQASRQSLLGPDLANDIARPREVQQGDFIMHYDPEISARRLVEVVNTETLENGNIRLTTVEPINLTSAKVSQTEFGPDEMILDIYRYDPNFTPDDDTLTSAHVGRIADAVRNVDLRSLTPETRATVQRMLNYDFENPELNIDAYREAMLDLINNRLTGRIGEVSVEEARRALDASMNRGLPTQTARNGVQAVSNASTRRAAQIGANTGQATPPTGGVPVASTPSPSTSISPNSLQRGPFSDEDGVEPGLTKNKFLELVTGVGSALTQSEREEELKRIILASVGGKQYGSTLTLSNFTFRLSNFSYTWNAEIVDPTVVDPSTGDPLKVGRASRSYRMDDIDGARVLDVHHNHVFIDISTYKKTGFATEFYQVSDNFYKSLVDINTIQTVQDGSYAWGAANFTWDLRQGTTGLSAIRRNLEDKAVTYESSNPVMATKLRDLAKRLNKRDRLSPDFPDPIDIASLLDPDDAERREEHIRVNGDLRTYRTLGRQILSGTGWYGIRYINPDLDPRPENRKNKKTLKEQQKEKATKEAEELEKSKSGPPQGRKITSFNEVSNASPGDVIQVTEPGYELIYVKQENGFWDVIYYGSDASSVRSDYNDEDLDIVDGFSGDIMSARIFTTPQEREYFSQYSAGTLKLDNPTRETVEKALRDGDIVTMEALYRGNLLGSGQSTFGRDNFTLSVTSSRIEQRGTDYDVYEVGGDILNENGQRVGPFRREIRMLPNGKLEMYHGIIKIEDDRYKRSGFGKEFTQQSEALYRQMGVDSIKLQTAWEGSYFWATQDYEWDLEYAGGSKYDILSGVPAALQNALDRTRLLEPPRPKDVAALQDIIDKMAGLEIDDPNFPSPREIAMMKSEDPSENDDGNGGDGAWMQFILKNTGWYGRKRFS